MYIKFSLLVSNFVLQRITSLNKYLTIIIISPRIATLRQSMPDYSIESIGFLLQILKESYKKFEFPEYLSQKVVFPPKVAHLTILAADVMEEPFTSFQLMHRNTGI